jgi:hypothetical protein
VLIVVVGFWTLLGLTATASDAIGSSTASIVGTSTLAPLVESPDSTSPAAYAYDAPTVYDGAAHSLQAHTGDAAPVALLVVSESVQGKETSAPGPLSVLFAKSVAADSAPGLVRAADVRFTQDSIGSSFRDGGSVLDLADEMAATGAAPKGMPAIRVFQQDGNLYSLDNRRLFAGQYADVSLPYQWASPAEIAARTQTQVAGGSGTFLRIGGRADWAWWQP